jgi:dihydroflavonol-4-reductase
MDASRIFWINRVVCVVGGTGFLGYHLTRQLLEDGAHVRVLGLPSKSDHPLHGHPDVAMHVGDVRDPQAVRQAVSGCAVVFNAAGIVAATARDIHAIHVEAVRNILAAADSGARIVHTSSAVAVGPTANGIPLTEDSPFPAHAAGIDYVHAKRTAEEEALAAVASGRDVVVVNPGYLVGPEDHGLSAMGRVCVRFWNGRLPAAPPGGFNLVDVRDVARGHLLAAERGKAGRRYLLGGENRSLADFCALLAETARMRPRLMPRLPGWAMFGLAALAEGRARLTGKVPFPSFQEARLNRLFWFFRSDRAERELGYHARPLVESIADAYRWFCGRGVLRLNPWRRWWLRPAA